MTLFVLLTSFFKFQTQIINGMLGRYSDRFQTLLTRTRSLCLYDPEEVPISITLYTNGILSDTKSLNF